MASDYYFRRLHRRPHRIELLLCAWFRLEREDEVRTDIAKLRIQVSKIFNLKLYPRKAGKSILNLIFLT